jgi:hypothetical protein
VRQDEDSAGDCSDTEKGPQFGREKFSELGKTAVINSEGSVWSRIVLVGTHAFV